MGPNILWIGRDWYASCSGASGVGKHRRRNLIAICALAICQAATLVIAVSAFDGCTSAWRGSETAAANVLIPPEQEAKLGQQIEAELATQVRFGSDPRVTSYVGELPGPVFAVGNR